MSFIASENIRRFRAMPETETNPQKREILRTPLADEEASLAREEKADLHRRDGAPGDP
jgi:hypothetical protein